MEHSTSFFYTVEFINFYLCFMKTQLFTSRFLVISSLILAGALSRLIPHPGNFTAIGAIALFGGAYISDKRFAFLVPILSMMISDLFIPGGFSAVVYSCLAATVGIGVLLSKKVIVRNVIMASLSSSLLFFLVTNLPFWYTNPDLYTEDMSGLIASYTAALPFFTNAIAGDLFFSGVLFGSFYLLQKRFTVLAR